MSNRSKSLLFADFRAWMLDERDYTRATREGYLEKVQTIDRRLAGLNTNVAACSLSNLKKIIFKLPPEAATRNAYRAALAAFFTFLGDRGLRSDNPAKLLPRLRERKGIPRPLAETDIDQYWKTAKRLSGKFLLIAALGLFCGLRVSEMAQLEWADVAQDSVYIRGKGRKDRMVPLAPETRSALISWRAKSNSARWVFPSPYRDRPVDRRRLMDWHHRILHVAGLPQGGIHVLRHTFATEALDVSGNVAAVSRLLGHSSPAVTSIYAKVKDQRLQEIVSQLYASSDEGA